MCVAISLLPGASLTEEEVIKMNRTNGDGCGLAWARGGVVHWIKTTRVNPSYIAEVIDQYKDFSRLVHFRLATAGGTKVELCHPFEIGPLATCSQRGKSSRVLIHNGHFGRWKELLELAEKEGILPDKGPWSDSRLIAFMAHMDLDWLQMLSDSGKVAVLDGDGQIYHMGNGWQDHREGVRVSNFHWKDKDYSVGGYPGYRTWPGWQNEEEDWEKWAAWEEEEAKRKAAEAAALVEAREKAEKSQAAIKEHSSGIVTANGNGYGHPSSHHRAVWEKEIAERDAKDAARAARKTHKPGKAYDPTPWTHPETGDVYEVRANGLVVKTATGPVPAITGLNSDTPES